MAKKRTTKREKIELEDKSEKTMTSDKVKKEVKELPEIVTIVGTGKAPQLKKGAEFTVNKVMAELLISQGKAELK